MSSIHVLEGTGTHFKVVAHFAMPGGSNSGGLTWKAAALAAGYTGSTVLPEGTGPAQIDAAEKASVVAGNTGEIVVQILDESGGTGRVQAIVNAEIARTLAEWQRRLRFYGLEIA